MLEWVDYPDLGRVVLPITPIRLHDTDVVAAMPSPHLGHWRCREWRREQSRQEDWRRRREWAERRHWEHRHFPPPYRGY